MKTDSAPGEIIARYEKGVLIPLQNDIGLREHQTVRLHIVPSRVCITAETARRRVNRFILDEISYLMGSEQPTLIETDELIWRVPVFLTYPTHGVVGQVGFVDVDAESGELLLTPDTIKDIKRNAHTLATRLSSEATA